MIPKDIESGEQWQTRWSQPPNDTEIIRTGTEAQCRKMVKLFADRFPILERRTITVSAWEEIDPDAPAEPEDPDED